MKKNQPTLNTIKLSLHNLHKIKTQKQSKNQHTSFTHHYQLRLADALSHTKFKS
jgi:hypothetical protein